MTKIFNPSLLLLSFAIMTIGMLASCEKNDDKVNSGKVELLSFGPTGARHGDTLSFIGNNLDQVTTIQFTGATVEKSAFLKQTPELILVKVPNETVQGFVTLKTPTGDLVSKTQFNLEVPVKITSMTPQARPGENITIKGDFMNWVTRVTFGLNKAVDSFVSKSLTEIVVKVPIDAQTDKLTLSTGGTEPLTIVTDDVLTVKLPVITGLSPNPVKHQTNLTITGTDLDLTKQILFTGGDTVATFISQTATQLVVKAPSKTQKGKVTLVAASGVKTVSTMDLDVVLPAVTTMNPNPIDPGTDLTITGTNLDLVTSVTFDNAPAVTSFVSKTATQIVVTTPMGILRGKITLGVLNSTVKALSTDILEINGAVPPPTIALPIYNDAVTTNWTNTGGWTGGGWGGAKDLNSTSPVREGTKSVKIDYVGGYGSPLQLGHNAGDSLLIGSYTTFKISIYGAPGSGGKKVNVGINGADKYTITVVEGTWTDYAIPLSTLTSGSFIKEILVKEYSGSGGFTIYVDALGLN
jgi:hypothetical protein